VSEDFIRKLIASYPIKTCSLDPLPSPIFKLCLDDIIPVITSVINDSLASGIVYDYLKQATVKPLLKKHGLDAEVLKNYRPISTLPFVAKILERVVLTQLNTHLESNSLLDIYQSAYKKNHSTETALLHVTNTLLSKADTKNVSLLALLDLSAAFDTLDHHILLSRLQTTFGVTGCALKWFSSYLSSRFQRVAVGPHLSEPLPLKYGVPQGSVLGPVLFTLYTQPISQTITDHALKHHKYADDTQLNDSAPPPEMPAVIQSMELCISAVKAWMTCTKLKLNGDKTEVLLSGSKRSLALLGDTLLSIDSSPIKPKPCVKKLGVFLDSTLSMHDQVSHICKTANFELRKISSVRSFLTTAAAAQLVSSLILSRLDYCNSLLSGLPAEELSRLQRVQNNAARLILKQSKRNHVTPLLIKLHWLPVSFRIQYKIASLVFRLFDNSLPPYLCSLLSEYQPSRSLRSSSERLLVVPKVNTKSQGQRSFSYQAPTVWNALPSSLRHASSLSMFKSSLKTYLFQKAFSLQP
jgi:hypothetical protein